MGLNIGRGAARGRVIRKWVEKPKRQVGYFCFVNYGLSNYCLYIIERIKGNFIGGCEDVD